MALVQVPVDVPPPFNLTDIVDGGGHRLYAWDITDSEHARLSAVFGRDFAECDVAGTYLTAPPSPCACCGKWTEFIDWVYTALMRKVHSPQFMFNSLKNTKMPKETAHDVYCSRCGTLTQARSRNNAEGGAPNVFAAGPLKKYQSSESTSAENVAQVEETSTGWPDREEGWTYSKKQVADAIPWWAESPTPWKRSKNPAGDAVTVTKTDTNTNAATDTIPWWAESPTPWKRSKTPAGDSNAKTNAADDTTTKADANTDAIPWWAESPTPWKRSKTPAGDSNAKTNASDDTTTKADTNTDAIPWWAESPQIWKWSKQQPSSDSIAKTGIDTETPKDAIPWWAESPQIWKRSKQQKQDSLANAPEASSATVDSSI